MKKIFLLIAVFTYSFTSFSQSLEVKIEPSKNYTWSVLYKLSNVKQNYILHKNPDKEKKSFIYDMSKQKPGVYMFSYGIHTQKSVYFIYNNKNVKLTIYPNKNDKVEVNESVENSIYLPYVLKRDNLVRSLRTIEQKKANNQIKKEDIIEFNKLKSELTQLQKESIEKAKGTPVEKYIINMEEYFGDINLDKNQYFSDKMKYYFEKLNFDDEDIKNSNIIIRKINNYVFHINPPTNIATKHKEYLSRIESVLGKIKDKEYQNNVIFSLTTSFVDTDGRVVKKLIENFIKPMSKEEKSQVNIQALLDQVGVTIGEKAPDFNFKDVSKTHNLHKISKEKPYTLLVFWSATCPHCLHAMPKIQKTFEKRKDFSVIAIGLESEMFPWNNEFTYYPEFYHGIKLKKWDNPIVKTYGIQATPSYFILNQKRIIVAKPYDLEEIKAFLKEIDNKN